MKKKLEESQIGIQLRELDELARDIVDGDFEGRNEEIGLEIRQRTNAIREQLSSHAKKAGVVGGKSRSGSKVSAAQENISAAIIMRMTEKTPEERQKQARDAANKRWGNDKKS